MDEPSARATSEIAQRINEIQGATEASVGTISAIADVIRNVDSVSGTIARAIEEQSNVTSEISRTVEETSNAAREVAQQIASVSREAAETGRRASEIRDGSTEIADKADDLRATLVRVIRTSTTEVDRRRSARVPIDGRGTLIADNKRYSVRIRDISLGGARIDGIPQSLTSAAFVALSIDGMIGDLSGRIGRIEGTTAVVLLELSDADQTKLDRLLRQKAA